MNWRNKEKKLMKVAITSTGSNLDSQIDPRFGRCQYFIIINPETMQFEAIQNSNLQAGSGAGIATAQMIAQKGVDTVITGNVGPNAFQTLSAGGIKIIVGASGTVKEAIELYRKGELKSTVGPSVGAHFGTGGGGGQGQGQGTSMGGGQGQGQGTSMGGGQGQGQGMGMGQGRGMGMGGGMGQGRGMSMGFPQAPYESGQMGPTNPQMSKEQKLTMLKTQTQAIVQQLEQIKTKIKELEGN